MNFFRKSLFRKIFFYLLFFSVLIVSLYYSLGYFGIPIPKYALPVAVFLFLILFLVVYYFDTVVPLHILMMQVQNLLANKPYKRIFTKRIDEVGVLSYFFNQVTRGIGGVSSGLLDRKRMLDELEVAATLQKDVLPLRMPEVDGLQIVAKTRSASEVGGDSFNVFTLKNGKTIIYIGDVTGHGVAAGLIMTMVNSLISVFSGISKNGVDILINVNLNIKKHVKKAMFMTLFLLTWDPKQKKMTYVGAGHEHILHYHADSGECDAILSGGVALGMVPDNSGLLSEKDLDLSDGDFVVLYTDGITEARNEADELFGLDRLRSAVRLYAPQYGADGVNYHIAKTVVAFMGKHSQDDDITLIVIKVGGGKISSSALNTDWN